MEVSSTATIKIDQTSKALSKMTAKESTSRGGVRRSVAGAACLTGDGLQHGPHHGL